MSGAWESGVAGQFDEEFDFVVVGCGGGSMCSGLVMRQAGKSVVILEKTGLAGGTTARSGGVMWVPNNRFMKAAGISDSPEKALTYLQHLSGGDPTARGATRERQMKYIAEAPRMIDFLVKQGVKLTRTDTWPDYYDDAPGGSPDSRSVFSEIFDANELGAWRDKLQPGFLNMPGNLGEVMKLPHFKKSWVSKRTLVKVGLRGVLAKLTGKRYLSAGAALQGQMLKAALKAGVDIRLNSPVTEVLIEGDRAIGVLTEKNGKPWRVGARLGVLVNAGGFARNQAMRDKYIPGTKVEWTSVPEGDTGEMIEELMSKGAASAQLEEFVGNQFTPLPGWQDAMVKPAMQAVTAKPHAILVDQSGVRYMSEGGSYMAYCKGMLARNKTVPALPSWAIFDERLLTNYMFAGTMPGLKKTQAWIDAGYLHKADSIEELATKIGVDPKALRGTVERFNGFVDKGVDEDFHRGENHYDAWLGDPYLKPSPSLGKIEKGPFYAVEVLPGDVGTYGGVLTDASSRVVREDGQPIEGLYATGVTTASAFGRAYPGAGASVGPSFTWGFIAAKHAANLDNQTA